MSSFNGKFSLSSTISSFSSNFFSNSCVIQDHTQGKMIGMGRRVGNLYILNTSNVFPKSCSTPIVCNNASLDHSTIWHFRLDHPYAKISTMQNYFQIVQSFENTSHWFICHLAKQHHLPFTSNSFSDPPFQLVHCDIWDPFITLTIERYRYFLTIVDDCTCFT